jgi:hypothetical protein
MSRNRTRKSILTLSIRVGRLKAAAFVLTMLALAPPFVPTLRAISPPEVELQISLQHQNGILLEWGESLDGVTLEYRDSFVEGEWRPCPPEDQWPRKASSYLDSRPLADSRIYRLTGPLPTWPRGTLFSAEHVRTISQFEISLLMALAGISGVTPDNAVDVYSITYNTVDFHGNSVLASGSLVVPNGISGPLPLASYQHGTILKKEEAPSNLGSYESFPGVILSSGGYVVAAPDYLGLGEGSGRHPYVLTKPTATAVVDMLRAVRLFFSFETAEAPLTLNGQLFLLGASQGGHATMAAHREIETLHPDEFTITASVPISGPYDLSGTMVNRLISPEPYSTPYYLPYAFLAYNDAYQLYSSIDEIFVEPYASSFVTLFDGAHGEDEVLASLPAIPREMLQPEFLAAFESDPDHPLRAALRENDLYDWAPKAPMRIYHCAGDQTVPKANAEIALAHFHANGATQVEFHDPLPSADHGGCSLPALFSAKAWFDTLKE